MSSNAVNESVIKDAAEGATKGALDWSAQRITELVRRFKQRELAFIEDNETIDLVRSQKEKPAWKLVGRFVKDKDLRLQVLMGFTLKKLETDLNLVKLQNLRDKIRRKYGTPGLHVAQLVQNDIFSKHFDILLKNADSDRDVEAEAANLLNNVDKYVEFVQAGDDFNRKARIITTRINANLPAVFIIFSCGSPAIDLSKKVMQAVMADIEGYSLELQIKNNPDKLYQFLIKAPVEPR